MTSLEEYVFGNIIYEPVDRYLAGVDFDRLFGPIYRGLGFDLTPIGIDGEPRDGKHASPVCFGVRIPGEIYVLYQRTSPVADYTASLYRQYVGLEMPGRYWQTHHVLGQTDVYAPSYLLAKVRAAELGRVLVDRFSERWWRRPEAGAFLREELMGPGRAIDLGAFSRLDPEPYLTSLGLSAGVAE